VLPRAGRNEAVFPPSSLPQTPRTTAPPPLPQDRRATRDEQRR
jgi:hypothetical protein